MDAHPVGIVVRDDLHRSRLTVFFRLLLAIPHYLWLLLWTLAAVVAAVVNWGATLVRGRPPDGLHGFLSAYVRYVTHLGAYLYLVADPYPPFDGRTSGYPLDLDLPEPAEQGRWWAFFRLVLALPALLVALVLGGGFPTAGWTTENGVTWNTEVKATGLASTVAVLGWFASVVRGRMPKGLRDAAAYGLGYNAQALAYLLLVTGRYPDADPTALLAGVERPPEHPVRLVGDAHDLRRSRVTVLLRPLLALPHLVWLSLWFVLVALASIANWVVTLVRGTPAEPLYRFTARWVRYRLHVNAFLWLAANPFPGFTGEPDSYPLDLQLAAPAQQERWKTFFRLLLALPAFAVDGALAVALVVAAVFTWFVALVRGSASEGLRNLSAYALRYDAQVLAYLLLVTDEYPHASPLEGAFAEHVDA